MTVDSVLEISIDDDPDIELNNKIKARLIDITNDATNVATTNKKTSSK